jgi:hypothetical protein
VKLPEAEQHAPEWQGAAEVLMLIGEHGGDPMMAHIAMMRRCIGISPNRHLPPTRRRAKTFRIVREAPLRCPGCGARLPFGPGKRMLTAEIMESTVSKTGLDNRHRNHDGEISHKHGNTLIGTLRKIYGQSFAAGHPETRTLSEVLLQLNETSLSQLRRDHETGHLKKKIAKASK